MLFKRNITEELRWWKENHDGRTAAVVEGAPGVGKTAVVRGFVEANYRTSIILDLSREPSEVLDLFRDGSDPDRFFLRLQLIKAVDLHERESAVVFDNIQSHPRAREMVKQLVEDHRYDYIEVGSGISLRRNVKGIRIPSEEHHITMHPMDFGEWLRANGDTASENILRRFLRSREPLGPSVHRRMMERFGLYTAVGGMPQMVDEYLRTNNMMAVDARKREYLDRCRAGLTDPGKVRSRYALAMFDGIPSMLSSGSGRFSPGRSVEGSRTRSFSGSIEYLRETGLMVPCHRCNDPGTTVGLTGDTRVFRPYLMDTGLLFPMVFGPDGPGIRDAYLSVMDGDVAINRGMFLRNMVAQLLAARGHDLLFHQSDDGICGVDFLIHGRGGTCPISVRPALSSRHRPLDTFRERYGGRVDTPYVIHGGDLRVDDDGTVCVPVYMTMFL